MIALLVPHVCVACSSRYAVFCLPLNIGTPRVRADSFIPLKERYKLRGHKTTTQSHQIYTAVRRNAVQGVDNAMPCHRTGRQAQHTIRSPATQMYS